MSELYQPIFNGMSGARDSTVELVKTLNPGAKAILDLASGPGEPACALALAFPAATVIASDVAPAMVEAAMGHAKRQGVTLKCLVMDACDLSKIPSGSQDVVTSNFGLIFVSDLRLALREIRRVLKPGGCLVTTVWERFALVPIVSKTMMDVLTPPNGPDAVAALAAAAADDSAAAAAAIQDPALKRAIELSTAAHSLSDTAQMDAKLRNAGLRPAAGHNTTGELVFDLGQAYGSKTWKTGLILVLPELIRIKEEGEATGVKEKKEVLKRAKRNFDEAAVPSVHRGRVVLEPSVFRTVAVFKSLSCCSLLGDAMYECTR